VFLKRLLIVAKLGLWPVLAHAATPEETQSQLQDVQQILAQSNAKVEAITTALATALKAQSDLSDRLVELGRTMQSQQDNAATADARINALESQSVTLASDLAARRDELSKLLSGLMQLQQNPPPALVVQPANVLNALRGAMLFGAVVPDLKAKADTVRGKLDELQAIRDATEAERIKQQETLTALAASQTELQALQQQKLAFAESAQKDLSAEKQNLANLADKAKSLEQLLTELRKAKDDEERKKTAEAKAAADAAAKAEADRREALLGPLKALSSLKGRLQYPVHGDVIKNFGDDTGLGTKLDGLAMATPANASVSSPVDGKVEFAGPFRSYGQLLILDAGEGYLVLLAGMKQISAGMGQTVRVGEPVGTMGEGPSTLALLGEMKDETRPIFYVEFRKTDAPVDSTPWWDPGKREAMR